MPEIGISDVIYIKDFLLLLTFTNGEQKLADLGPYLNGEMLQPLRDHTEFVQFALLHHTLQWANGADVAPEFLYEIGTSVVEKPQSTALQYA